MWPEGSVEWRSSLCLVFKWCRFTCVWPLVLTAGTFWRKLTWVSGVPADWGFLQRRSSQPFGACSPLNLRTDTKQECIVRNQQKKVVIRERMWKYTLHQQYFLQTKTMRVWTIFFWFGAYLQNVALGAVSGTLRGLSLCALGLRNPALAPLGCCYDKQRQTRKTGKLHGTSKFPHNIPNWCKAFVIT